MVYLFNYINGLNQVCPPTSGRKMEGQGLFRTLPGKIFSGILSEREKTVYGVADGVTPRPL